MQHSVILMVGEAMFTFPCTAPSEAAAIQAAHILFPKADWIGVSAD